MKGRADVTVWLNGARDYPQGYTLWQSLKEHSKRKWLGSVLANGPDPVSSAYLLEEMKLLNGEEKEEEPVLLAPSLRSRKRLELADHSSAPQKILEARREFKEIMTQITTLRTEIRTSEGVKDKRYRASRAKKIVELTRERRRLIGVFHVYDKTGEVPKDDNILISREDVKAMIRDYKNHISYLGSWKNKKGKEAECAQRQARIDEIDEFLNT
jgi:hypothetical protein